MSRLISIVVFCFHPTELRTNNVVYHFLTHNSSNVAFKKALDVGNDTYEKKVQHNCIVRISFTTTEKLKGKELD